MPKLKGTRPRPRVALIGDFEEDTIDIFKKLFPTIWYASDLEELENQISPIEIDLTIIAPQYSFSTRELNYFYKVLNHSHVICFSDEAQHLPGPEENSSLIISKESTTEEYKISELLLPYFNLLESNLTGATNARGWPLLDLQIDYRTGSNIPDKEQLAVLLDGSLLFDPHTCKPFASRFTRLDSKLGVAWLPNKFFNISSWVELICMTWAETDQARFPDFGNWTKNPIWMTHEEESLHSEIEKLNSDLSKMTNKFTRQISELTKKLVETSLTINLSKRRLITSQGDNLLDEVAKSFEELGYKVIRVDEELDEGQRKKEDLRIQDPDVKDWEAIVEVRGHLKSSGQASDLQRIYKFAHLYYLETGREPIDVHQSWLRLRPA
jgi:hypothetical protein